MAKDKICRPFVGIIAPENKFTVDTIDDLKSRNYLTIGDTIDLNGYYTAGDGAHHKRKIESADDGSGVQLANGLWANIVHNGEIEAGWFGGNSSNDIDYKNKEIQKVLDYFRDYESTLKLDFNKKHKVNSKLECVWTVTDTFVKEINGVIEGDFNNLEEVFFKVGVETENTCTVSAKRLDLKIKLSGDCKAILKLYTKGNPKLAFWASKFKLQLDCRRGYGLWVENGFFENTIESLRVGLMRKYQETDELKIGDESIGYLLTNEEGESTISSLKHNFINIWGGKNSVLTKSFSGKYPPDFTADEVHIFDTTDNGLVLNNQGSNGCYINNLHAEFIGKPDGRDYWACFWNGGGTINKIEGGGDETVTGMVGFLRVYNTTKTPFVCNSSGKPYLMPFLKSLVSVHVNNGAKFFANGYYFNPDNTTGDISFETYTNGEIISSRYDVTLENGIIRKMIDKKNLAFLENQGVTGRLSGKAYNENGIMNVFTTTESYEDYVPDRFFLKFGQASTPEHSGSKFAFFNKEPIAKRRLESYNVDDAVKKLALFFFDMGLASELAGSAFVSSYNLEFLDTPYYTVKMQQENVYEDFVAYMDAKLEYDKEQRYLEEQRQLAFESREDQEQTYEEWLATQPVLIPDNEPQPSEKLLEFKTNISCRRYL